MNKTLKRTSVVLVCVLLFATVFVLGGWTSVSKVKVAAQSINNTVEDEATTMSDSETGSIMPRGGGQKDCQFIFDGGYVTFGVTAENWWWPGTDQLILNITSNSSVAYYRVYVEFVWTNAPKMTTWALPSMYFEHKDAFLILDEMNGSSYYKRYTQQCNESSNSGSAGDRWACENINIMFEAKIGNEPAQSAGPFAVHF